jgi:hypothetical protein
MGSTSDTLLGWTRDLSGQQAWQEFEARYTPRLLAWCRGKGLQFADAQDVVLVQREQELCLRGSSDGLGTTTLSNYVVQIEGWPSRAA